MCVAMCVHVYVCVYMCMRMYLCTDMYMYMDTCVHVYIFTYIHAYLYTHIYPPPQPQQPTSVSVDHPDRFRVELWFSPGASHNPFELVPLANDHTLPMRPRTPLHPDSGVSWANFSRLLKPYSARVKASTYPSTLAQWRGDTGGRGGGSMASFASGDGGRVSRG